jgi:hypothetical protein
MTMTLAIGRTLRGRKASYKLIDSLKNASVFKAAVVEAANQEPQPDVVTAKLYVLFSLK